MLTSLWSSITTGTTTTSSAAQAVTPTAFANWPIATQINFVKANGTGTPPFAVIGMAGSGQVLAALTPGQDGVETSPIPGNFSTAPANLALSDFDAWSEDLQAYYIRQNGTGTPPSVSIGAASSAVLATLGSDGATVTLTSSAALAGSEDVLLNTPLGQMSAASFFALTPDRQLAYLSRLNGQIPTPPQVPTQAQNALLENVITLQGGDPASNRIVLTYNGTTYSAAILADAFPGYFDPTTSEIGTVTSDTFATWPPGVQTAYAVKVSAGAGQAASQYPKTIVLRAATSGDGVTVIIPSAGAQAETVANPAGFGAALSGTPPTPTAFLDWPYASQLAYARFETGSATSGALTLGTDPNSIAVTVTGSGSGLTVTSNFDVTQLAGTIDVDLFLTLLTPAQQAQYLTRFGTGNPRILTIQTSSGPMLMSGASATSGGAVTLEALPANFATPPASLDPSAFMAWDAAVRQAYVAANGGTVASSLVIGPAATATTPANQLTASISSADGTLQIITPNTLSATGQIDNTLPYTTLGNGSTTNRDTANTLFPLLQGDPTQAGSTLTPLPDGFTTPPNQLDAGTFGTWNSAVQLQYIRQNIGGAASLQIGLAGGQNGTIDVFIQAPKVPQTIAQKVYTVQVLQKQDIAQMAYADQLTLAGLPAFQSLAVSLGLIPDGVIAAANGTAATTPPSALSVVQALIATALGMITDPTKANAQFVEGAMPAADLKVFTDEINLVATQLANTAIFSQKDIQDKLDAITTRFTRAYAFAMSLDTVASPVNGQYTIQNATGIENVGSAGFVNRNDALTVYLNQNGADHTDNMQSFVDFWLNGSSSAFTNLMNSLNIASYTAPGAVPDAGAILIPSSTAFTQNGSTLTLDGVTVQLDQAYTQNQGSPNDLNQSGLFDGAAEDHKVYSVNINGKYYYYRIVEASGKEQNGTVSQYDRFFDSTGNITQSDPGKTDSEYIFPTTDGAKQGMLTTFFSKDASTGQPQTQDRSQSYVIAQVRAKYPNLDTILADGKPHTFSGLNIQNTSNNSLPDHQSSGAATSATITTITLSWTPGAKPSLDNNAAIKSGYQTFMAQETTILDLANRSQLLATTGKLTTQNLDVPNLVFLFQLYANLSGEAVVRDDTEEVNQTNNLLQTYAVMQQIINQTVAKIDKSVDDAGLTGSNADGTFTDQEKAALGIFTNQPPLSALSPIELLKGVKRPTIDPKAMLNSGAWGQAGTALSDSVTLINQDSQIKMNDINSETKQKDRNFDLANSALSKMSDIIQKIAAD